MFTIMMSDMDVNLFAESHNPVAALVLLVLFVFIMSMVLLNCLIALMSGDGSNLAYLFFAQNKAFLMPETQLLLQMLPGR